MQIKELYEIVKKAINEGKGDMEVVWARGGEDELVYKVDGAYLDDIVLHNGDIDGVMMIDTNGYEDIGILPPEAEEDDSEEESFVSRMYDDQPEAKGDEASAYSQL